MLRLGWLLILVPSVFAAPPVTVTQYSENEIGPLRNDGRYSYLTRRALEIMDGGELKVNFLTPLSVIHDLVNINPALGFGQTLAILGELASGYPGDSCATASLLQGYASGNPNAIRQGLINYARQLANNIDLIVQLAIDRASVKYATGSRGGCIGGGRTYDFEDVWNINLASATPRTSSLFTEEYCAAKRLYSVFNARSNNVGATLTASITPAVQELFKFAYDPIFNFMRALDAEKNRKQAATVAKKAIVLGATRVNV